MNSTILRMVAGRVLSGFGSLLAVSVVVFAITAVLPGDAAEEKLGQDATPEAVSALRKEMGLDRSAVERYVSWLGGIATGDPGKSVVNGMPVSEAVASRLPNSLLLAAVTAACAVPLALGLGILCALWRGSTFDRVTSMTTVAVVCVPEFLVATLAVLVFAVHLEWLPALSSAASLSSPGEMLRSFALPVLALGSVITAQMLRMTRAAVIDQLSAAYVEMVRLKGATAARTVLFHALPNAIGPIANAVALSLSYLLGGVIIIEVIFNYPGIAKLMVDAVAQRDMPLVQACTMIFCAAYLILVLLADVCGIVANPRLRHQ
ncbi:ABC transporter permease [Ramlibacter henchirensis]|uniref:ABC transporter permease n=1 Tax=Ramlibacter henchirensis TaxID=204072 RepID=A0A4Z0C288_9BURK|nr:ABC transporter permease [Ramlibacter henchirensis]TFZ05646.1 ABC transporter permease [Ramlibacter henchirensis]